MKNNKLRIEDIIFKFKGKDFFTYEELYKFYKENEPELKIGTLKWRIYKLKEIGVITVIKKGVFILDSSKEYVPKISANIKILYNYLFNKYPYAQIIVWETSWLHNFMNHQPFSSIVVVEVDKDIMEPAFYALKEKRNEVYINQKGNDIEKYISNENVIVIKSVIKDAPNKIIDKVSIPKIEKILVDLFFENELFRIYQGQELINIFERIFEDYSVNLTTLYRYARNRGIKEKLVNFIVKNTNIKNSFV